MSADHRSQGWLRKAMTCGALLAIAALALPAQAAHADPDPSGQASDGDFLADLPPTDRPAPPGGLAEEDLRALLDRLQSLYQQAEEATEAYNKAEDDLGRQRDLLAELDRELADQRADIRENRTAAGEMARQQYRELGLSDYSRLLLSDDPREAFDHGHDLSLAADAQAAVIQRLLDEEADLAKLVEDQEKALEKAEKLADEQGEARKTVEDRLATVEGIVSTLTGAQRDELTRLEKAGTQAAQTEFVNSGALGYGSRAPSGPGEQAIAYAFQQLGDPYLWGATGPNAFDCSGLTSQAWAHAGRPIPRTSQEQWKSLPKVPMNQLRPGDLVLYYPGATHVALYIGDGRIVQAPRTGDVVKISPIAAMPILGAVRPDPAEKPAAGAGTPQAPQAS